MQTDGTAGLIRRIITSQGRRKAKRDPSGFSQEEQQRMARCYDAGSLDRALQRVGSGKGLTMEKKQQDRIIEYYKLGMRAEAIADYMRVSLDSVKFVIEAAKKGLDSVKDGREQLQG